MPDLTYCGMTFEEIRALFHFTLEHNPNGGRLLFAASEWQEYPEWVRDMATSVLEGQDDND